MTDGNAMAFARPAYQYASGGYDAPIDGLTKREHFAAMAMQGFLASMPPELYSQVRDGTLGFRILAESAVVQANALITALNKEENR